MATVLRPVRRGGSPFWGYSDAPAEVDTDNPLCERMGPCGWGNRHWNGVAGRRGLGDGYDSETPRRIGLGTSSYAWPNGGYDVFPLPDQESDDEFTLFLHLNTAGVSPNEGYIAVSRASNAASGFGIKSDSSGRPRAIMYTSASGGDVAVAPAHPGFWTTTTMVATFKRGEGLKIYVHGQLKASLATENAIYWGSGTRYLILGAFASGSSNHRAYNFGVTRRAWTAEEVASYHENPWQLWRTPQRTILLPFTADAPSLGDLAGSGSATANGTATPTYDFALAALGVTVAGGGADLSADISVGAVGYQVTGGAAALSSSAVEDLGATGGVQSGGSGTPYANISIAAADLATAAGQAGLSAEWLMAGAGAALASGNAALAAQLNALAQGSAQTGGTAALDGGAAGELSAAGGAQSAGVAAIKIVATFFAQGSSQTAGAAALDGGATGEISAAGSVTTTGQAGVRLDTLVTAAGFVQAMGAGYLVIQAPLEAIGGAASAGLATLEDAAALVLIKSPRFVVAATGRRFSIAAPGRTFKVSR